MGIQKHAGRMQPEPTLMKSGKNTGMEMIGIALALLVTGSASAALINIGPGSFTPLAPKITFDGMLGQVNPSVTLSAETLGNVTVSFAGSFLGQTIVNTGQTTTFGDTKTLEDFYPDPMLTLDSTTSVVVNDGAPGHTSPVLSGAPTFHGPIAIKFSAPVNAVGLKVGYFDTIGATTIMAYDVNGTVLGSVVNTAKGFEFYGLADSSGQNVIAGLSLFLTGIDPNGFEIDDITFGAADVIVPVPEPSSYLAGVLLAGLFGVQTIRKMRTRKPA